MSEKFVYFFGGGSADGKAEMKELLGGKGANLAEMTNLGIPVPPGFTISTGVCKSYYDNNKTYTDAVKKQVAENVAKLEKVLVKKFGDPSNPLLVSVRSGAAVSMPGMMDTVLNLGLNDEVVEAVAKTTGNPRFAWDAYRRFIQMFGDVAMGVPHHDFEGILADVKKEKGVKEDLDLDADDLKEVVKRYKAAYKSYLKEDFPQDPMIQLWAAIDAVFGSWNNPRAIKYRAINGIVGLLGTAVNVQSMVFGNYGETSGTGVCFTRDPSTGENYFYGEYLMNAQGEDVVAGIRTPETLSSLEKANPEIYKQLVGFKDKLENHYKDMQDIEFTIQEGVLYILQTRNAKRTGPAAVRCAVEMVESGDITKETAVTRVTPDQLDQLLHPMIDKKTKGSLELLAKGLNASPGAACGQVVFTADEAEKWVEEGKKVLLVRRDTSPEDIGGMVVAEGILTSTGGMTSHAAVVARGMGTPCVAGCKDLDISNKTVKVLGKVIKEGDWLTIDGTTGEVFNGEVPLVDVTFDERLTKFLSWADEIRLSAERKGLPKGFLVRTNADQPADAKIARDFGAEGIGLCRTEHMFFEGEKLQSFQRMIVAKDVEKRKAALANILPLQIKDFSGIFEAMDGLPVTVRLLDPPLHEFVPHTDEDIKSLAATIGITAEELKTKVDSLHELNPMLGHRGCRLGITYPEIYDMQVEAIMTAACEQTKKGIKVLPEIMIPLIGTYIELKMLRENAEKVIASVFKKQGITVEHKIGTMIEIPRAAITADEVAKYADFFSFGTNDLTQMTFGYSRDDIAGFLPDYLGQGVLERDPFQAIDQSGVGVLVEMAAQKSRALKPEIKLGICGEHGGEGSSIEFCYRTGLNYVSCSPYRVPLARLSAAQAVLKNR